MEKDMNIDLRFGYVSEMYYNVVSLPMPKQLDLIHTWFPGLIVEIREGDGKQKEEPVYDDQKYTIFASRYHDYLYAQGDKRIAQITGRLVGTAKSNYEKERKTAELIQKHVSRRIVNEMDPVIRLTEHTAFMIGQMNEEQLNTFHHILYDFCIDLAEKYDGMDEWEKDNVPFPMDNETIDQIIYNTFYELLKYTFDGVVNAYQWLLTGSLLRNETGRITRMFNSSWVPRNKAHSELGTITDKLKYLLFSEEYESYYTGDDLEKRFPGIEWYCDACEAHLNEQDGFDDHLDAWQCRKCGHINRIAFEEIFDNDDDFQNGILRHTEEEFQQAVENRKKDLYHKKADQ